jgi:hypothetical protein
MLVAIIVLALLVLGNVLLSFSIIGSSAQSTAALFSEVQHQARVTRKALVQLLNPEEPTEEQKTLSAIVSSPEFSAAVIEDARKKCEAQGVRWFGESDQEAQS